MWRWGRLSRGYTSCQCPPPNLRFGQMGGGMTDEQDKSADGKSLALPNASANSAATVRFEAHFPVGCPPSDAVFGPKLVFRLCAGGLPEAGDFLSHYEKGLLPDADPCQRCGLSVYVTQEGAEITKRTIPYFRRHKIVSGSVPANAGKLASTPSRQNRFHWSWWPASGIVRHSFFSVVS